MSNSLQALNNRKYAQYVPDDRIGPTRDRGTMLQPGSLIKKIVQHRSIQKTNTFNETYERNRFEHAKISTFTLTAKVNLAKENLER